MVNDLIARFGAAGAVALLNSQITSATAVAAGIKAPYPNFTNAAVQTIRSVAQALRPFPQYPTVNTTDQRRRQDRPFDVSRRRPEAEAADDGRSPVSGQLHLLETDDRRRHVQRQQRLDGCGAA